MFRNVLLELPKLDAAGSIPVSRSKSSQCLRLFFPMKNFFYKIIGHNRNYFSDVKFPFIPFHPSYFIHNLLFVSLCFSAVLFFSGCSAAVKPQLPQDTPMDHYQAGIKLIGTKDAAKADAEFLRVIELDKKSPLGYVGMAALEMSRTKYKSSIYYANKALRCESKCAEAGILKSRAIISARKKNWSSRAKLTLRNVLDNDPGNEEALFYMGETCLYNFQFEEAQGFFSQAAERKGSLASRANDRIKLTIRILALGALSDTGKKISLSEQLTRAELCQILIDEFKLKDLLKIHQLHKFESAYLDSKPKTKIFQDREKIQNRQAIHDIIALHIPDLDIFPDGKFYPSRIITRAELALVFQDIFVMLFDDQTLPAKYSDSESIFPDIRPDYFAFNAVMFNVEEGIMEPDPQTGRFNTDSPVSGVDALEMLRALAEKSGQ
jgi:tetratricopeptide (TPR) repeat protein